MESMIYILESFDDLSFPKINKLWGFGGGGEGAVSICILKEKKNEFYR